MADNDTGKEPKVVEDKGKERVDAELPHQTAPNEPNGQNPQGSQNGPDSGTTTSTQSASSPKNHRRALTQPLRSGISSANTSPKASREGSPIRPSFKSSVSMGTRSAGRSRKNSQDLSPVRGHSASAASFPTVPSAAAIQRALSAAGAAALPPQSQQDAAADTPRSHRSNKANSAASKSAPRTPRLGSPPPTNASSSTAKTITAPARKAEHSQSTPSTPSIVVDRPSRVPNITAEPDSIEEEPVPRAGMRTPVRGTSGSGSMLETVQEGGSPTSPALGASRQADRSKSAGHERPERIEESPMEEALSNEGKTKIESGNESAGSKSVVQKTTDPSKDSGRTVAVPASSRPPAIQSKKSYTQLPIKGKSASEASVKNMTVETETVSSIPQVAVGGGTGGPTRADTGGSLRGKPSTETIRPKKEKKKVARKAPSANAGAGRSLSRIFHYYHPHSRTSSAELEDSSPMGSPDSIQGQGLVEDAFICPLHLSRAKDACSMMRSPAHGSFPTNSSASPRRFSSGLIPFRGRLASSKADIFEAKVASAVDEADSSDSAETFVYESNPPEPLSARPHRFHSRTPSTASTLSQIDPHGLKGRLDRDHSIVGKKSMKFANNYNSITYADDADGTVRGPHQTARGGGSGHHHHIGKVGRGGHTSLFDSESPFPRVVKSPRSATSHFQQGSPKHGPKTPYSLRMSGSSRKADELSSYDMEGEGADDERAPLIGSMRSGRNRRRPLPGSVRQMYSNGERDHRLCGRVTALSSLASVLALLIAAIVIILVLCTKPLFEVYVKDIRNVLASESELMLDLRVRAINPNIIAIQVSDLDINLFAKSRHIAPAFASGHQHRSKHLLPLVNVVKADSTFSKSSNRKSHQYPSPLQTPEDLMDQLDGIDEGTDPVDDDPASDSQTMLLGRILAFDSPLIFDPSPLHHRSLGSVGEVRLSRPGNRTEEGGSARWERVLQYDFELIVRGVVKYSLPISSRIRSASIGASVIVHPSEDDGEGNMRLSQPSHHQDPGSNVILIPPHNVPMRGIERGTGAKGRMGKDPGGLRWVNG